MARYRLDCDGSGYYLADRFSRQNPLRANFDEPALLARLARAGKKNELVARAVKAESGLRVFDATAGLGRDSLILAHLGCKVTLCERSPVVFCLLQDAIERASDHESLHVAASRMRLINEDAILQLRSHTPEYDVIYLDPMFPEKTGSAAVRGGMQYLQRFVGTDLDTDHLLAAALESNCDRVVLKRPARLASVVEGQPQPMYVLKNRNSRYEVYSPSISGASMLT